MRRQITLWSLFLLSICMVRIALPSIALTFAGFELIFAIIGGLIALTTIALTHFFENIDFRPLFAFGAVASFCFFVLCLYYPTLGGLRHTYLSAMDLFVVLESSLILGAAAIEEKTEALPVFTAINLTSQLLSRRLRSEPGSRGVHRPRYS